MQSGAAARSRRPATPETSTTPSIGDERETTRASFHLQGMINDLLEKADYPIAEKTISSPEVLSYKNDKETGQAITFLENNSPGSEEFRKKIRQGHWRNKPQTRALFVPFVHVLYFLSFLF